MPNLTGMPTSMTHAGIAGVWLPTHLSNMMPEHVHMLDTRTFFSPMAREDLELLYGSGDLTFQLRHAHVVLNSDRKFGLQRRLPQYFMKRQDTGRGRASVDNISKNGSIRDPDRTA